MISRNLALEKFYEKDIVEFLDEYAISNKRNEFKSRIVLLEELLKDKDYKKADNILREYVLEYNSINPDNVYKEINFNKIKKGIELFKTVNRNDKKARDVLRVAEIFEERQKEDTIPLKLDFYEIKDSEDQQKIMEEQEILYSEKQKLDKIITNATKKLYINIRKKEIREAIKYYEVIKKCFEEYPSKFDEDKRAIYNDILGYYVELNNLKKYLEKQGYSISDVDLNLEKHIKLEYILKKIEQIKEETRRENFKEAEETLLELNHIKNKIPQEYTHIKNKLQTEITNITKIIQLIKQKKEHEKELEENTKIRRMRLENILKKIEHIKEETRRENFKEAEETLLELNHIKNKIPQEYTHIKNKLQTEITNITKIIQLIKQKRAKTENSFKEELKTLMEKIKEALEQKEYNKAKLLVEKIEKIKQSLPEDKITIKEYLNSKIELINKKIEVEV